MFSTTDQVLEGARHMVAMQIARDPLVRQCVREAYYERAKITVKPTKKGKKVPSPYHYLTISLPLPLYYLTVTLPLQHLPLMSGKLTVPYHDHVST